MATNRTWDDFVQFFMSEARVQIARIDPVGNKEFTEVLNNQIFDDPGPRTLQRTLTRDEAYFQRIQYGFSEIETCIERLKDIETYIGSFPYRSEKLNKIRHLRYHIESYFHETYILRERIRAYLTRIGRAFKNDNRHSKVLAATRPLFASTNSTLQGVSNTRSGHVHQARFDPQDLSRLDTINLIAGFDDWQELMQPYFEFEYRRIRREWKQQLRENNKAIRSLLDMIADGLIPVIFNVRRKRLKYPRPAANRGGRKRSPAS